MGIRTVATAAAFALAVGSANANVFEVIHADVEKDGFEFESINTLTLSDVAAGDEKSVHEIAFSYAPTSWWKPIAALEIANPQGGNAEIEAFEFGSVFLLPLGDGHAHSHDHSHGAGGARETHFTLAGFVGFELPNEAGLNEAALSFGPIIEVEHGPWLVIGNLFAEVPFADGVDPGLAYAASAAHSVGPNWRLGVEAHGEVQEAFGNAPAFDQQEHFIGPAAYSAFDLGHGRILEPRIALLAGYTDAAADAVLSFNLELKF
ncbi:hypothetical protein [Minwuia thermotolerans]|nr:hypothetical protein [Minwuia thermotolerans]